MSLSKRRGILWPSFEIYGGVAGFFDYGPLGSQIKLNIENIFRRYYVIEEGFEEIYTAHVAPEPVYRASGHLSEFTDLMVECDNCGQGFRADHLVDHIEEDADGMSGDELDGLIRDHGIKCPVCGGTLSRSEPFNLMFKTNIGPGSSKAGYLRPETAQGMFLNFRPLYRYSRNKLPFGIVQIGTVFRNEISPRQGMVRLREFNQAEAEIFIHPDDRSHPGLRRVWDDRFNFVPARGEEGEYTVKDALERDLICSEIMAYYIAITGRYLLEIGLDPARMRFRQHGEDEMAHYASDCWDAEALTSFGWIELVGIADRTDYDLGAHIRDSGEDLKAYIPFEEARTQKKSRIVTDPSVLGPMFKSDASAVKEAVESMDPDAVRGKDSLTVEVNGQETKVPGDAFRVEDVEEKVSGKKVVPHVIEPSYGVDRIIYSILEHSYKETEKEGEEYSLMRLKPGVAPIKAGVFPLMSKEDLPDLAQAINQKLRARGIRTYYDEGGTIGRRYARMDEVGTPWCVTVDFESREDEKVTIRNRDTTEQKRVDIDMVPTLLLELLEGKTFDEIG